MLGRIYQGRNIKRLREVLGIKQEAMVRELGNDRSQKKISVLQQKKALEETILDQVSDILKIPVEVIQNFDEQLAVNIISYTFNNRDHSNCLNLYPSFQYSPIDKLIQLHEEIIAHYQSMQKDKDEMMAKLEKLLETK